MITLDMMPPLMFGGLVLFMLFGYPVSFSLAALGIAFGFVAIDHGFFTFSYLQAIPGRVFGNVLSNDLLLAVPFFTFMGAILERCGLAEDMLDSMVPVVRPDPGRPRLLGHHRRLHPGRHHRHRRRPGHRHGTDLDAGDDPIQIQYPLHHRRAGRVRHHHPARAAVARADRARRPARQVGGRYVSRRLGPSIIQIGCLRCIPSRCRS